MKFHVHTEKVHLCFYEKSTNQALTFINSKVVSFGILPHIKYSTHEKQSLHCHKMFRMTARQIGLQ